MKPAVVAFLLVVCVQASAQPRIMKVDGTSITTRSVDALVAKLMDTAHVPGLGIVVLNRNKAAYIRCYGYKNNHTKEPLDTATVLYGASFSKAVFAYLCMQLVQDGKIALDTPLYRYLPKPLPQYENYRDLVDDDRWKLITPRMCLSHTTGFPNWRFLNATTGNYEANGKLAVYFTPGSRYAYSGEGITLLQMAIEAKTGRTLEELAEQLIFRPFGMRRSSYVWQTRFENNYALGTDVDGNPIQKKKRTRANAAGSLETTLADYARFIEAVMQGKGLTRSTRQSMLTPQIAIKSKYQFPTISNDTTDRFRSVQLSYGLGWGLLKTPFGKAFFKEGHDDGWQHYNINFVDKGISLIIMTNSSNSEKIFKELLEKIIDDRYTPWQWERYVPYNFVAKQ